MAAPSFAEQERAISEKLAGLPAKVELHWLETDIPTMAMNLSFEIGFRVTPRQIWNARQQSKRK